MRKVLFLIFLVVGTIVFSSNCNWYENNTGYANKMVELVKTAKLTNKIYCDIEKNKMVYETVDKENVSSLEIGLVYNKGGSKVDLTYIEIADYIDKFENDINKLYPWKNLTELEYSNSPEYYKYRMYIYSPENKEEFMAYLIVYDTINGEWKRFYSKDFWNKNDENDAGMIEVMEEMGTKATDDIAY